MTTYPDRSQSHISIAMPDGTTCRAFITFEVYASDDVDGEIVRMDFVNFARLATIVATNRARARQVLTDLPHSPERTQMKL